MAAPHVRISFASILWCWTRGWTGHKCRISSFQFDPSGDRTQPTSLGNHPLCHLAGSIILLFVKSLRFFMSIYYCFNKFVRCLSAEVHLLTCNLEPDQIFKNPSDEFNFTKASFSMFIKWASYIHYATMQKLNRSIYEQKLKIVEIKSLNRNPNLRCDIYIDLKSTSAFNK